MVFVRSDWSKQWTADPVEAKELAASRDYSSVGLDALKFLHHKRDILFHGHEPLDTDTTPTLEGEFWLMHNGYAQAEGVANLDGVPATGCLVSFGFPKFKGGLGGYARYVAICPPEHEEGRQGRAARDAPLPRVRERPALGRRARLSRPLTGGAPASVAEVYARASSQRRGVRRVRTGCPAERTRRHSATVSPAGMSHST